jgi:ADP-ribose pyrophosphatase YjhB (NUDIX family)
MNLLAFLDEIQTIARNGLLYTADPYDHERYERLLALSSAVYGQALDLPPPEVRRRLAAELGHVTPKVGADAAIFDGDGRILLMRRSDDDTWCLPCGWVEPNEAPAAAAVREAREETGLDVQVVELVAVLSRLASPVSGAHAMVAVVYLCDVVGGSLQGSHEGPDLRYWAIEDVPVWHPQHRERALAARASWQARQARS